MTHAELDRQIELTLRRNSAVLQRAGERAGRLIRVAERRDPAFDRALEKLRQGLR